MYFNIFVNETDIVSMIKLTFVCEYIWIKVDMMSDGFVYRK